jgi:hypothetical protein
VLLTLVRVWHTLATGDITTKDGAAAWAADRLSDPSRDVVRKARGEYLAGTHGDWIQLTDEARRTAEQIVERIRSLG